MSEAKIPNRDQMTGSWKRTIEYNDTVNDKIVCPLSDITWCTKWVATKDDYTTVHEITTESIQNAYAAGYTREDIKDKTGFSVPDRERLRLTNSPHNDSRLQYHDIGNYSFHGAKAKIAHLYAMMYAVTHDADFNLDNMFELNTLQDDSFHVKRSTIDQSRKNESTEIRELVPVDKVRQILASARKIQQRTSGLKFEVGNDFYECVFKVDDEKIDLNDIWPVKGRLVDIFDNEQVYGAGEIGRVTVELTLVTFGSWDQLEYVEDEIVVEDGEQKNSTRQFRNDRNEHGLSAVKRALHSACSDHFITVPEPVDISDKKPLGLEDSFWSHLNIEGMAPSPLVDLIKRRQRNQFDDMSNSAPLYGRIRTEFRPAQKAALDLMFRENHLRSGIYVLPCGGGKTLLGIAAAVRSGSKHVLILVPNETIELQWKKRLYERAKVRAKTMKDIRVMKKKEVHKYPLVAIVSWNVLAWGVCKTVSAQEAMRERRKNGRKIAGVENILFCFWDMVIIDEVHNVRTEQNRCLMSKLSYRTIIGLTATASKENDDRDPWYVDIAPLMFETAWPIDKSKVYNINCTPLGEHKMHLDAIIDSNTVSSMQQNGKYKDTIFEQMKQSLPTYMTNYKHMLEFNPKKLEKVVKLIEHHERENEPVIVFANTIAYMKILQRRFVTLPRLGSHSDFGDYLRKSVDKYIYNVRAEFISPFGTEVNDETKSQWEYTFGTDDDEDDDEGPWETRFITRWDHTQWTGTGIQTKLMEMCPNVPFDANFCHHYVSNLRERVEQEMQGIIDILGKNIDNVSQVSDSVWAQLFYLFDTPRWVMFGKNSSDHPYNIQREHRHRVYEKFNQGRIKTLFLSRIGNEGIDLPETRVIIVMNGMGGSETEDAQRFGRALRGETGTRYFYEVFTDTGHDRLNEEKNDVFTREKFLKARGYFFKDVYYDVPPDHDWLPFDSGIPVAHPWFFVTPKFKIQRPDTIWLQARIYDDKREQLYIDHVNSTCNYLRKYRDSDNNYNMAFYIAKEFGYTLNQSYINNSYHLM